MNTEMNYECNNVVEAEKDQEQDDMGSTAITFILLFLITLLFSIVTTAFKVIMSLYVRVVHRLNSTRERKLGK